MVCCNLGKEDLDDCNNMDLGASAEDLDRLWDRYRE